MGVGPGHGICESSEWSSYIGTVETKALSKSLHWLSISFHSFKQCERYHLLTAFALWPNQEYTEENTLHELEESRCWGPAAWVGILAPNLGGTGYQPFNLSGPTSSAHEDRKAYFTGRMGRNEIIYASVWYGDWHTDFINTGYYYYYCDHQLYNQYTLMSEDLQVVNDPLISFTPGGSYLEREQGTFWRQILSCACMLTFLRGNSTWRRAEKPKNRICGFISHMMKEVLWGQGEPSSGPEKWLLTHVYTTNGTLSLCQSLSLEWPHWCCPPF